MDLGTEHQWMLTLKKKSENRLCVLPNERTHHNYALGKGIRPESGQASGSSCQFTGNTEDKGVW